MSHFDPQKINPEFIKNYQRQMPENRILAHKFVKSAIDSKQATFTQLSRLFFTERSKLYRIYAGFDTDYLPSQWALEEDEFIKLHHGKMTYQGIADLLGRTIGGVQYRAIILGLSKSRTLANPAHNG